MINSDPKKAGVAILEAVENQLKANAPPKVKEALKRLMSQGINREESKKYIASALPVEIFGAIKNVQNSILKDTTRIWINYLNSIKRINKTVLKTTCNITLPLLF